MFYHSDRLISVFPRCLRVVLIVPNDAKSFAAYHPFVFFLVLSIFGHLPSVNFENNDATSASDS
jgi:hypothetical protein